MYKPIIYPYRIYSSSAKVLSNNLDSKRVHEGGLYRYKPNHLVINWGNPRFPKWLTDKVKFLNHPEAVEDAGNKLTSFQLFQGANLPIPSFTTDFTLASEWAKEKPVVSRKLLRGSGGRGIVISSILGPLESPYVDPEALMWVEYKKKKEEYRIHVFDGTVIDVQKKGKRAGVEANYQIRNHENGWVFMRENVKVSKEAEQIAIAAVKALRLDFGAVDIIYNQKEDRYYVLEVNTAPGLEGTTIDTYCKAIRDYAERLGSNQKGEASA